MIDMPFRTLYSRSSENVSFNAFIRSERNVKGNYEEDIYTESESYKESEKGTSFENSEESNLEKIPPEILQSIFSHLPKGDKLSACLVNSFWKQNIIETAICHYPEYNRIRLDYQQFIACLEPYVDERVMTNLILIKNNFDSRSVFPDLLINDMKETLFEILKKLKMDELEKVEKLAPKKKFFALVRLSHIYQKINSTEQTEFEQKKIGFQIFNEILSEEADIIIEILDILNCHNKEFFIKDLILNLMYFKHFEAAIKLMNYIKEPDHIRLFVYLAKENFIQSLKCAFLLNDRYHQLLAFTYICRSIDCGMSVRESAFEPISTLMNVCAKLDNFELALEVAINMTDLSMKHTILNKLVYILSQSKDPEKIKKAGEIASLISCEKKEED